MDLDHIKGFMSGRRSSRLVLVVFDLVSDLVSDVVSGLDVLRSRVDRS